MGELIPIFEWPEIQERIAADFTVSSRELAKRWGCSVRTVNKIKHRFDEEYMYSRPMVTKTALTLVPKGDDAS